MFRSFVNHELEFALHAAATWYMIGVIWLIQLVHYPMMAFLERSGFQRAHSFHTRAITWVVMPGMLVELATAVSIFRRRGLENLPATAGLGLLILIWGVTFFIMVPLHDRLQKSGPDSRVHADLCRWNWMRTFAWSIRGLLVVLWF